MTRNLILLSVLVVAAGLILVGGVSAQEAPRERPAVRDTQATFDGSAAETDSPPPARRNVDARRARRRERSEPAGMSPEAMVGMTPGGRIRMLRGDNPRIEQMHVMVEMIEKIGEVAFAPETAGLMAIGGLKDDVRRSPEKIAEDLESILSETKTLGLRNALRMTLKDIYKRIGEDEKVLDHLRAMIKENDAAMSD